MITELREGYTYRIIAPGSNSVYVGQSIDPTRRFKQHKKHPGNPALANFLKKHPDATMHPWPTNDMDADEIADEQLCRDMGFKVLNCAPCGGSSPIRKGHKFGPPSDEHRAHLSAAMMGNKSRLGMRASESTKKKMSESQKKIDRSQNRVTPACLAASIVAKLGKARSSEVRAKISAAKIGKPWSPARRATHERKAG